jgi:hypothetical protein
MDPQIAHALNWRGGSRVPMETKFGVAGARTAKALVDEVKSHIGLR